MKSCRVSRRKCFPENPESGLHFKSKLKATYLKGLDTCSLNLWWKWTCADIIDAPLLSSDNKQVEIWKPGCCPRVQHHKTPSLLVFFSQHLKLQNKLPLAAAQSLRSKKRQNLTKKLILGHLWNSIIRPIFQTPASSANRL